MADPRVVSLIPSATEIVAALGYADRLVGRSHECDFPAGVEVLPSVTRALVANAGTSREIHEKIGEAWRAQSEAGRALSIYEVDRAALRALEPDVIITQSQCEVCAVSLADVERAVCDWAGRDVAIVSCEPHGWADVLDDVRQVAAAIGDAAVGERLVGQMGAAVAGYRERVAGRKPVRVASLEWLDPLMGAGNWVPELVSMAGGVERLAEAGAHSGWVEWEQVAAGRPEVLVCLPCGFDLGRAAAEAARLRDMPGWGDLPAVRAGRVYAVDGHQYFNRPGPRLVDSVHTLGELFHPDVFEPVHEGEAWRRIS